MEFYDPQMLAVMAFGGFMFISAIGIFLVSTFSMKETTYEEALAKQRKELEKASQHKMEKKKKERSVEKKGKGKRGEEKPNGKTLEPDLGLDNTDSFKDASPEPVLIIEPIASQLPVTSVSVVPQVEKSDPSPKDKKKKERKYTTSNELVSDGKPKEVSVSAFPTLRSQQHSPFINLATVKTSEDLGNQEELKHDRESKKKTNVKKKRESTTIDDDSIPYIPYKTLISIIRNTFFDESEVQELIEILTKKGGPQDPWLVATQKGDPIAVLKRQLEDKEKQLAMEHENATAVKTKLNALTKEFASEKARTITTENKWKEQLQAQKQEMSTVEAQMQTSKQQYKMQIQQLQEKIQTLQEQLQNGTNDQLAHLQQENCNLRDALNQATSQTEHKQNTELAKLLQDYNKLSKELTEKMEVLQEVEEQKKALEMKTVAHEEQIRLLQISQKESEGLLQESLDDVREELCKSQANYQCLQIDLEKAKEQQFDFAELQSKLLCSETELKRKVEECNNLHLKLSDETCINFQLEERIKSVEALLESSQMRDAEKNKDIQETNGAEIRCLLLRLQESSTQASTLEDEVSKLKHMVEQLKMENNDLTISLRETNEALRTLQAKCDQYRNILTETERMLKDLQKRLVEEQQVWQEKLAVSEEALAKTQDLVYSLQAELEKLRCDRKDSAYIKKEILQLQETLDNEKKLTKDLGCAITKLKELLKVTQEQLSKEREAVMKLQEQLQNREENEGIAKEGTSV
ncbi:ribosome-binding protein 1 isoform X1 [Crotalus tigris]|uniref:ribosome-binding protein 1 isoform X1 n=1 Tax=Crotalus tigris TaxID=88082 RepID=UPI00192F6CD1|nr:ribosome-binding protein 1 isoform X1 [Crotalus tigris]XP_039181810.1 ribosome-binding protein 1 isoform X1 [Crotalus tigris]XP_039181811.1 ribosome-binding protein 1 isoform X1 [Crotalus tigris]